MVLSGGGPFGGLFTSAKLNGTRGGYGAPESNGDISTDTSTAIGSGGSGGNVDSSFGRAGNGGSASGGNCYAYCGSLSLGGGGGGGAGGGMIRLIASESIQVSGTVDASGAGFADLLGGYGAGGGILLQAPTVDLTGGKVITLGGVGRGSGTGNRENGGTIKIFAQTFIGVPNYAMAGRIYLDAGKPKTLMAGYLDTSLTSEFGGSLTVAAWMANAEEVEIFYEGTAPGVRLNPLPGWNNQVFVLAPLNVPAGGIYGRWPLELRTSKSEVMLPSWPFLLVE